jgi:hypothetical protein
MRGTTQHSSEHHRWNERRFIQHESLRTAKLLRAGKTAPMNNHQ